MESGGTTAITVFSFALVVGLATVPVVARLGPRLGLLDIPSNGHKTHSAPTPRTGGIALALAATAALATAYALNGLRLADHDPALLAGVLGFLIIGFSSDLHDARPEARFLVQVAMMLAIAALGFRVESLGTLFADEPILLGTAAALVFTAITGSCLVNGFNMLDGLDGQLVAVATPMLATLLVLAELSGSGAHVLMLAATAGALLAFACFNVRMFGRPYAAVFLGDAGSYGVGAVVTLSLILLSQPDGRLRPIDCVWIAGLPIVDTTNVVISRCARAAHFMRPGQDHIHHLLLSGGYSSRQVVLALGTASAVFCSVGLGGAFANWSESVLCGLFLALAVAYRLTTARFAAKR